MPAFAIVDDGSRHVIRNLTVYEFKFQQAHMEKPKGGTVFWKHLSDAVERPQLLLI